MLMTANIKRIFTNTFTKFHTLQIHESQVCLHYKNNQISQTQWFGTMTNTIYDMNILTVYITRTHRFTYI